MDALYVHTTGYGQHNPTLYMDDIGTKMFGLLGHQQIIIVFHYILVMHLDG